MAEFLGHLSGVLCCLACGLRRPHDRGLIVSRCNRAKMAQQYLLVLRTVKRRNMPHRFHAFVEIPRERLTPIVRISGEPQCYPNQSSAPPVMDYNQLTPGRAKETHPVIDWMSETDKKWTKFRSIAMIRILLFVQFDLILYVPSFSYVGTGLPGLNQY